MGDSVLQRLLFLAVGALVAAALCPALPPVLRRLGLDKRNYQGDPIGSGAGLLFLVSALPWFAVGPRPVVLLATAAVGYGLLGLADDRWGTAEFKGLRGHLRALRGGRVTTGLVKAVGGLGLAGVLAWLLRPGPEALVTAPLIALAANLFNLLDLRPLRALKAFWLLALLLSWSAPPLLAQLLGATLPYARLEARRRVMLGDTGANCLGGVLGTAAALALPLWAQGGALAALALFHLWAERYSLSAWIDARPWARRIDRWGWS